MIGHAEVVVDAVKVDDLNPLPLRGGHNGHVQRNLRLSGAVVSDENDDFFHSCLLVHPRRDTVLLLWFILSHSVRAGKMNGCSCQGSPRQARDKRPELFLDNTARSV